jgi:hypothetical protein
MPHARPRAHGDQLGTHGPERTHDDCLWLDEEDGKENVLGDGRDRNRCRRAPRVAEDERRHRNWENDAGSEDSV